MIHMPTQCATELLCSAFLLDTNHPDVFVSGKLSSTLKKISMMGNNYHLPNQHESKNLFWWLKRFAAVLILAMVVNLLFQEKPEEIPATDLPRVEIYSHEPETNQRAAPADYGNLRATIMGALNQRVFSTTGFNTNSWKREYSLETGNDNWFDTDLLLEDETAVQVTINWQYEIAVDLSQCYLGNIQNNGGVDGDNILVQVFLPEPYIARYQFTSLPVTIQSSGGQNWIEDLVNHSEHERRDREFRLSHEALKLAKDDWNQAIDQLGGSPSWEELVSQNPAEAQRVKGSLRKQVDYFFNQNTYLQTRGRDLVWYRVRFQ